MALASRRRADRHGPIGAPDMERLAVGLGEDGDGPEAQQPAGAEHAPCDLPPDSQPGRYESMTRKSGSKHLDPADVEQGNAPAVRPRRPPGEDPDRGVGPPEPPLHQALVTE